MNNQGQISQLVDTVIHMKDSSFIVAPGVTAGLVVVSRGGGGRVRMSMATEKLGIKIEKNPPESKLTQMEVRNWPK